MECAYCRKPETVQAWRLKFTKYSEIPNFIREAMKDKTIHITYYNEDESSNKITLSEGNNIIAYVHTPDGAVLRATNKDYIIRYRNGSFTVENWELFERSYMKTEEGN